jgi:predicted ATPase/DNA-binding CsgD family transcriptional regulator
VSLTAAGSGNVPAPLTRLFGREADIAALERLVGHKRLVTLTGPPGAGKSRLGVELARRLAPGFADGAWLVELAPVTEPSHVAAAVGMALHIDERRSGSMVDALADGLADRELLLVMDNCEHIVAGAAEVVARLVADCAGVRVLAASRLPLGLPGEQVWPVAPLGGDAAVELFTDRARLASGGFRADAGIREQVRAICERLDGLPLAIELAAAWTRVLSPAQILARLDDALPLLAAVGRHAGPRHETMAATVDWSYQLLDPADQRLFTRLSVFPCWFDLAAAEAVAEEPGEDVLAGVTALVDHSLVQVKPGSGDAMRYLMLEPLRQYGAARLAAGDEHEPIGRRHAEHFLERARRYDRALRGDGRSAAFDLFERDEADFLAALDRALADRSDLGLQLGAALGQWWELRGPVHVHRSYMEALLAVDTPDRRLRSTILARAARLAWREQDHARARDLLQQSLAIVRATGDDMAVARRLRLLGLVETFDGDTDAAADLAAQGVALSRAHDDQRELTQALVAAAWAAYLGGDAATGDDHMRDALTTSREHGFEAGTALALQGLTYGAQLRGDVAAARRHLVDHVAVVRRTGMDRGELSWIWAGAVLAADEGRYETALRLLGAAEAQSRRRGTELETRVLPPLRPRLDRAAAALREGAADRLAAEGSRMSTDALMAEACAEPEPEPVSRPDEAVDPLSPREREVVELVGEGLTNSEIAETLFISKRTVESHVDHIKQKLGHVSRSQVIAWAVRRASGGAAAPAGA